jgi:hypothetical protein
MSSTPRETQDYRDVTATTRHLVRKSFHPPWVFKKLLGQLLVILQKCNERESKRGGAEARRLPQSPQRIVDARVMDYVHFVQAFDKAIDRVKRYDSVLDPFMNYCDWDTKVDKEVYFDDEEDKRPLPLWMNEWVEEVGSKVPVDLEARGMGNKKKKLTAMLKGLGDSPN